MMISKSSTTLTATNSIPPQQCHDYTGAEYCISSSYKESSPRFIVLCKSNTQAIMLTLPHTGRHCYDGEASSAKTQAKAHCLGLISAILPNNWLAQKFLCQVQDQARFQPLEWDTSELTNDKATIIANGLSI
jgi:hypothetical protein